ncbi:MAG: hypothetical protein VX938_10465, partial [Myxococcota bacterium]|nr:hypothetical protein [Myxococcota bacterium]
MRRHLIITVLLMGLSLVSTSVVLADPVTPEWEDKAPPLALNGFTTSSNIAPVWMDADMDGVMEVVYIGFNASRVLDIDENDGSYGSYKLDIQGGGPLEGVGLPAPVLSLLDVDRDDTPELLIMGKELRIFRLTAPYEFTDMEIALPM